MIIGLTGGIASGKTAASDTLATLGADVIDTDVIARQVVAPGSDGLKQVVSAFGKAVLQKDGGLNRAALRERIFSDKAARTRLEGILHPLIRQQVQLELTNSTAPYAVLVVPLLVESPALQALCDRILLIDVDEASQLERLSQRDGVTPAQARAALAAQSTRQQRLAIADDVIENQGSLEALRRAVARQHERYLALVDQISLR
jgi:dephospho-CoA kinase